MDPSFLYPSHSSSFSSSRINRNGIRRNFFLLFVSSIFFLFPSHHQNSIIQQFYHFSKQNIRLRRRLTFVTRFSIFTSYTIVCRLFGIPKSARRVEEEQGRRRERLSSKTAYFNVITISQLRPRHHRYQQDVRRRVKLTTAHVNEHR